MRLLQENVGLWTPGFCANAPGKLVETKLMLNDTSAGGAFKRKHRGNTSQRNLLHEKLINHTFTNIFLFEKLFFNAFL